MVDAFNMLVLMLPGASVTYNGEEIGMLDTYVRESKLVDTTGRDPERTPMQWSTKKNAGNFQKLVDVGKGRGCVKSISHGMWAFYLLLTLRPSQYCVASHLPTVQNK